MAEQLTMNRAAENLRRTRLLQLIRGSIDRERRRAIFNDRVEMSLLIVAICASGGAGFIALATLADRRILGALALVPGFFALLANTLNFSGRAFHHYRKKRELEGLHNKLEIETPSDPTDEQLISISASYSEINKKFDAAYERNFSLNWSFARQRMHHDLDQKE